MSMSVLLHAFVFFANHLIQKSIHLHLILIPLKFAAHTHPFSAVIHESISAHSHLDDPQYKHHPHTVEQLQ